MRTPNRSSLVNRLTCPRCSRHQGAAIEVEAFRAMPTCHNDRCRQHWWCMWLVSGSVEPQLADVFGPELARELMETWALPASIDTPKLWQLSLSRHQYEAHAKAGSRGLLRALLELIRQPATVL